MSPLDLVDLLWQYRFLGREFLLWLWYLSETAPEGLVDIPGVGPVALMVGDKIVLEAGEGEYRSSVAVVGSHSDYREARSGLWEGKLPAEMHLKLARDRLEWQFTLKAATLEVKGLKSSGYQPAAGEEDEEAAFFDQMGQIEEVCDLVDGLYARFIQIRTGPDWNEGELARLRQWVQEGVGRE